MSPREKLSVFFSQTVRLKTVLLKLCVSIYAKKKLERKLLSLNSSRRRFGRKQETFGFFAFDFSIKLIKSVASLRCDFVILILAVAMYLYQQQKKEILSLRPSDES